MTTTPHGRPFPRPAVSALPQPVLPALTRRNFLRLTAGAGAGLMLGACSGGSGGGQGAGTATGTATGTAGATAAAGEYTGPAVDLAFWNGFTGGDGPLLLEIVNRFNEEHENINVAMNALEWAQFYSTLPSATSSGEGPDVAAMHLDQIATNAARGVIMPLDDVAAGLELSESDFAGTVWNAGIYQDVRYGIPLDVHMYGFYYNKTLMEQAGLDPESPPQTRDEYMAALEALKAEGIQGHWVSPFLFTGGHTFYSLLWQFGGDLFNEDVSEATWNSEAGVEAITWMRSLIEEGYSPADVGQDAEHVAFQNDQNAFIWNGIWQINGYGDTEGLEWGVAQIPQIGDERAVWASSHNFVIPNNRGADPNKQQAAAVFIDWVSEQSLDWAKAGQVPARNSVRESAEFAELTEQNVFAEELDYVHFVPTVPGIPDAMAEIETGVNEAILGSKEPQQALDDAAQRANEALEANRERYQA